MNGEARDAGHRLLRRAEADAERAAAIVRLVVSIGLLIGIEIVLSDSGIGGPEGLQVQRQIDAARLFLFALFGLGILTFVAQRYGWGGRARPYLAVTLDAALILGNLAYSLHLWELPGNFFVLMPVIWIVPAAVAGMVIQLRVGLQIYVTCLYFSGIVAVWLALGTAPPIERAERLPEMSLLLGAPPLWVRLIMLAALGGVLIVVAWRGRVLLLKAVEDAVGRAALSRFLPSEIAPLMYSDEGRSLRAGRRQAATMLFVDIRNSVSYAEGLDPERLSVFITAFRRRIADAATSYGGVIDKFIGDGALIVFGLPEPRPDDARRAVLCARRIERAIARWNAKRGFDQLVRVGIGIHTGEVYCGLVGDQSRLEFTVLGDAVNVAARIEQATKMHDATILVSETTLAAAGEDVASWQEVSREPVRGRAEPVVLFASRPGEADRAAAEPLSAA